jgi:hypothetical protein
MVTASHGHCGRDECTMRSFFRFEAKRG